VLALLLFRGWYKKRPAQKSENPPRTALTFTPGGAVNKAGGAAGRARAPGPPAIDRAGRILHVDTASIPEKIEQDPFTLSDGLKMKYDELWGTQISQQSQEQARDDKKKVPRAAAARPRKKIELQATLVSPNGNVAILNGEEVSEGDIFQGYTVTRIDEWSVHLEKNGKVKVIEHSE